EADADRAGGAEQLAVALEGDPGGRAAGLRAAQPGRDVRLLEDVAEQQELAAGADERAQRALDAGRAIPLVQAAAAAADARAGGALEVARVAGDHGHREGEAG